MSKFNRKTNRLSQRITANAMALLMVAASSGYCVGTSAASLAEPNAFKNSMYKVGKISAIVAGSTLVVASLAKYISGSSQVRMDVPLALPSYPEIPDWLRLQAVWNAINTLLFRSELGHTTGKWGSKARKNELRLQLVKVFKEIFDYIDTNPQLLNEENVEDYKRIKEGILKDTSNYTKPILFKKIKKISKNIEEVLRPCVDKENFDEGSLNLLVSITEYLLDSERIIGSYENEKDPAKKNAERINAFVKFEKALKLISDKTSNKYLLSNPIKFADFVKKIEKEGNEKDGSIEFKKTKEYINEFRKLVIGLEKKDNRLE